MATPRWLPALLAAAFLALPGAARADLAAARSELDRGDYAAAEQALVAAITRTSTLRDRAEADDLTGRLYLETGRYDEARVLGERLGRVPATRAAGLTLEGEALAALGRYDDAVARWTTAVGRGPVRDVRRARALAATWLARLGRRDDARDAANGLLDEYNDAPPAERVGSHGRPSVLRDAGFLTDVGIAAGALGAVRDANQAFNEALRAQPGRADTDLEQAELMLSTEDMGPAGEAIREALRANPHSARALALRGRTRLMSDLDFVRAGEDLTAAAAVNPRLPAVFALRAAIALRDDDVTAADRELDQALAINPRDLESLAMRGVVRFFANDVGGLRRAFDALFAVSPVYAEGYVMLADFADWGHRYAEAADLMREGLARPGIASDRKLQARLRAELGINLLRMGQEDDGISELRASFEQSRFNVRVANLLNLYEQTIARDFETETDGPFRIRYPRAEHAALRRYVPGLLHRAWDDMVRRYGFTPEGPISIELYGNSEQFSVRTSGLPEIGVQGVCFGRVVTALSPQGGPFNWGQILWHELAHVFAIQRSRSRVPRWFTEGLSEWEAFHSHPEWAREDDPALYRALVAGRGPPVGGFHTAFTHARRADDMLVAYYAASKLVEHLIDRYGFPRVAALLPLWGQGLSTEAVIRQGLGVAPGDIDRDFRQASLARLTPRYQNATALDPGDYRDRAHLEDLAGGHPDDPAAQAMAAAAAYFDGDAEHAAAFAERAVRLDVGSAVAHEVRLRLALTHHEGRAALEEVDAVVAAGRDGYDLRLLEARAAFAAHDDARVDRALAAASHADPTQVEAHLLLAGRYARAHRDADRLRELREVVRLDQHDRQSMDDLLQALESGHAWADIRTLDEQANNLDPENPAVHLVLAQAAQETGSPDAAVFEYESALALAPPNAAAIRTRIEAVRRGDHGLPPLTLPFRREPPAGSGPPGNAPRDAPGNVPAPPSARPSGAVEPPVT